MADNKSVVSVESVEDESLTNCGYCGYPEHDLKPLDPFEVKSQEIPFGNGEWIPVKPEREESIYWWGFPWRYKLHCKYDWQIHSGQPCSVWKIIAGGIITHLPEHCLEYMTPQLSSKLLEPERHAPQVIDFGPKYEPVLEYFTERMLGLNDYVPPEKQGLLNKLFDETGFKRDLEMVDKHGFVPNLYPI